MCMIDWRLGRLVRWNFIAAATTVTVPQNRQRTALLVTYEDVLPAPGVDQIVMSVPSLAGSPLLKRDLALSPIYLTLVEYGQVIQERMSVTTELQLSSVIVWESTLPESYLAAGLEQFESEYYKWKQSNSPPSVSPSFANINVP